MNNKVLVAMSGGVDSSVAAYLLKQQGYDTAGVTLRLVDKRLTEQSKCSSELNIIDSQNVAAIIGIKHFCKNYEVDFKKNVVDYFAESYIKGETPNPCVQCNKTVKFPATFKVAEELGYGRIATGHYVQVQYDEVSGRWLLKKGLDVTKDQSYVLYSLTQSQLSKTLFPIGGLSKTEVREIATAQSFINKDRPDSQDICFVPDGDYKSFVERNYTYASVPGDFVDNSGKVLGQHRGIIGYTTGQRRGLSISADRPLYVVKKNIEENSILLGDEKDLYSKSLVVKDVNFIAIEDLKTDLFCEVKVRYSQKTSSARLIPMGNGLVTVEFDTPQRAVTAGQSAVFYDGEIVIGGGTIK